MRVTKVGRIGKHDGGDARHPKGGMVAAEHVHQNRQPVAHFDGQDLQSGHPAAGRVGVPPAELDPCSHRHGGHKVAAELPLSSPLENPRQYEPEPWRVTLAAGAGGVANHLQVIQPLIGTLAACRPDESGASQQCSASGLFLLLVEADELDPASKLR